MEPGARGRAGLAAAGRRKSGSVQEYCVAGSGGGWGGRIIFISKSIRGRKFYKALLSFFYDILDPAFYFIFGYGKDYIIAVAGLRRGERRDLLSLSG